MYSGGQPKGRWAFQTQRTGVHKGVIRAGWSRDCVQTGDNTGIPGSPQSHYSPIGFGEMWWTALDTTSGCRGSVWELIGSPETSQAKRRQVRFVCRRITLATVWKQMDQVPFLVLPPVGRPAEEWLGRLSAPSFPCSVPISPKPVSEQTALMMLGCQV